MSVFSAGMYMLIKVIGASPFNDAPEILNNWLYTVELTANSTINNKLLIFFLSFLIKLI